MRLSVRSIPKKFNRAGLAFTEKASEVEVDEKTFEILKAERMLVVEVLPEVAGQDQKDTTKTETETGNGKGKK